MNDFSTQSDIIVLEPDPYQGKCDDKGTDNVDVPLFNHH